MTDAEVTAPRFTIHTWTHALRNGLLPAALGMAAYFSVIGWNPLRWNNIAWLQLDYDSAQHYIGWLFYRHSPWSFPVGANPDFGMEIGSSIVYSDSIPLFAVFFKLFSGVLPETFQYFGLWLLLCFVLQALFAWRLACLATDDAVIRACATGLFLFSPPFLYRACFTGAEALAGHWLILAGLYLCLAKKTGPKKWKWLTLTAIAGMVHAYILAMVLLLWVSDTLRRVFAGEIRLKALMYEYVFVISGVLLALWQAGYFTIASGQGMSGYGSIKMNVLAPINPAASYPPESHVMAETWSYVLPDLPQADVYEYEGFNYLGPGIILLFLIVLPRIITQVRRVRLDRTWIPLFLSCVLLTLFAVTNHIGIGQLTVTIPVPEKFIALAGIFRCSGRMFWPVYYLLLFSLLLFFIRSYGKKKVMAILLAILAVQAVDTSAGWWPKRQTNSVRGDMWVEPFKSPFWEKAASHYKKIRVIPSEASVDQKNKISYFAGRHHMSTDAVYLARYDTEKQALLDRHGSYLMNTGNYDTDTLYIIAAGLSDAGMATQYVNMAAHSLRSGRDLLALVDGYIIVAPGWTYGVDGGVIELRQ